MNERWLNLVLANLQAIQPDACLTLLLALEEACLAGVQSLPQFAALVYEAHPYPALLRENFQTLTEEVICADPPTPFLA
jgi:hypothetical protein